MTDELRVAFSAIIRSVSIKRTASEDREARLVLDFRPDEAALNGLVKLSQLEQEVMVGIVPTIENNKINRQGHARKRQDKQSERTPEGDPE